MSMVDRRSAPEYRILCIKDVYALSSMYRRKLNKRGNNWSPHNNLVYFVTPIFSLEVGPFPNVMELFQWLFQSHTCQCRSTQGEVAITRETQSLLGGLAGRLSAMAGATMPWQGGRGPPLLLESYREAAVRVCRRVPRSTAVLRKLHPARKALTGVCRPEHAVPAAPEAEWEGLGSGGEEPPGSALLLASAGPRLNLGQTQAK
jgi:hypothetical protein